MNCPDSQIKLALSVRQPWAWLIVHGLKDIENRNWAISFRGRILIHAGKRWTREERQDATLVRSEFGIDLPETFELGGIVGAVDIVDCVTGSSSRWFTGEYGFVLRNATVLPFKPLRGMLGFFKIEGAQSFRIPWREEA
jgi:hypothetical protein